MIAKVKNFIGEVRTEMQKVSWPTREELAGSTAVVMTTMLILSVFIGFSDFIFSHLIQAFLR